MRFLTDRLPVGQWLTRIRSKLAPSSADRQLQDLLERAAQASPSFRPQYNLQAARLAESLGFESEALSLYGQAIDGYLESGRGRAAEVVCREVVEVYPHVIRARRTLALIAIGRGDPAVAISAIREYAAAAKQFGEERLTRSSLLAIGLITEPGPIRDQAVTELRAIGYHPGAEMVTARELVPGDDFGSWTKAVEAAMVRPDELQNLALA